MSVCVVQSRAAEPGRADQHPGPIRTFRKKNPDPNPTIAKKPETGTDLISWS